MKFLRLTSQLFQQVFNNFLQLNGVAVIHLSFFGCRKWTLLRTGNTVRSVLSAFKSTFELNYVMVCILQVGCSCFQSVHQFRSDSSSSLASVASFSDPSCISAAFSAPLLRSYSSRVSRSLTFKSIPLISLLASSSGADFAFYERNSCSFTLF